MIIVFAIVFICCLATYILGYIFGFHAAIRRLEDMEEPRAKYRVLEAFDDGRER